MSNPRLTRPAWLAQAEAQFAAIEKLERGWDRHGGEPPDPRLIQAGRELLEALAAEGDFPKPHINPTPAGGVQFEWEVGPRCFEIEIMGRDHVGVLFEDGDAAVSEEWEARIDGSLDDLLDRIRRVVKGDKPH